MKLIRYKESKRKQKLISELRKKIIKKLFDYAQYVKGIDNMLYSDLIRIVKKYISKYEEDVKQGDDSIFD